MKNDSVEKSGRPARCSACAWVLALARSEATTVPRVPRSARRRRQRADPHILRGLIRLHLEFTAVAS